MRLNIWFVLVVFLYNKFSISDNDDRILCDLNAAIQFEPLSGWNCTYGVPLSPICKWDGIFCFNNSVMRITLDNRKVKGTIPTALGGLSRLASLVMNSNCLSGVIPSSIGLLSSTIMNINLNSNQLSNTIPSSLGMLTKMTNLVLYENKLNGSIPSELVNADSLGAIFLNDNSLTGSLPPLKGLANLQVQINSLTGIVPSSLCSSGLQKIDISSNLFSCYSSCLSNVRSRVMTGVPVCSPSAAPTVIPTPQDKVMCKIAAALSVVTSGSYTTKVQGWKCLHAMTPTIPVCPSLDVSPSQWSGVSCNSGNAVTSISLVNVRLAGSIPTTLSDLSLLTSLTLRGDSLHATLPTSLGLNSSSLSRLEISNNSLYGTIPTSFGSGKILSLNYLSLASNSLSGSVPSSLCRISSLSYLSIFNNHKITCYASCLSSVTALNANKLSTCSNANGGGRSNINSLYSSFSEKDKVVTLLGGSLAGFFILLIFLLIVYRVYLVPHRVTPLEPDIVLLPVGVEAHLFEVTATGITARTINTDDQFFSRGDPITLAEPIGLLVVQSP